MALPLGDKVCVCVADHNPEPRQLHKHHILPLYLDGPDSSDNLVWLCPTSHANVHVLFRRWESNQGEPAWWTRRLFSPYIRAMAEDGWNRYLATLEQS